MPDIDDSAPELDNSEQDDAKWDEGSQAQDVAEQARVRGTDMSEESEHGGRPNPAAITPDDTPDLVDRMNEMVRSGRIDNDAFAGEPQHDDEEDRLGNTDSDDDDA